LFDLLYFLNVAPLISSLPHPLPPSFVPVAVQLRDALNRVPQDQPVVIEATGRQVTGLELLSRIDAWRACLAQHHVGVGSLVGVALGRSIDQVAAIFALFELGAAYVPIDPNYPVARQEFIFNDVGISVIIIDRAARYLNDDSGSNVRVVEPPSWDVTVDNANPVSKPAHVCEPEELAYVIYTSGSSGKPKGVRITHANLCAFLHEWDALLDVSQPSTQRWLALTSLSFDPSVVELFWTISRGCSLVLASDVPAPGAVGALIIAHGVTHLQVTPTRAAMLASDHDDCAGLRKLEQMFIGGEALTAGLVRTLAANVRHLTNIYGPTETTVWAFSHDVLPTADVATIVDPIPIGKPLAFVRALVVDSLDALVPTGSLGEIVLIGNDVSPGYWHRLDQDAIGFRPIILDGVVTRCYRTGDLGLQRPDGLFEFHGRIDNQLKISGHRIEPAEVESVLMAVPHVELVAVVQRTIASVDRLVAFVQPAPEHQVTEESLRTACVAHLPKSHIPSVFVIAKTLDRTPSGKIDRGSLTVPVGNAMSTRTGEPNSSDGSSTSVSRLQRLCALWSTVLGKPVEPDDDYFALGGDSLGAVAILAEIARMYGEPLGLSVLVESSTPRLLLGEIDRGAHFRSTKVVFRGNPPGRNPSETGANEAVQSVGDTVAATSLRPNNPARILFLVHGAGGNVVNFVYLAKCLSERLSIVSFQAHGVTAKGADVDTSVEAMAERYLREILVEQPNGPYLVGGYSDGGIVAWEIARLLQHQGKTVERVLLLDTALPPTPNHDVRSEPRGVTIWKNFRDRQQSVRTWVGSMIEAQRTPKSKAIVADRDLAQLPNIDVQAQVEAATDAYLVSPLAIDVELIRAANTRVLLWSDFRWKRYVQGRFRVWFSSGDHLGLVSAKNSGELAELVERVLF
jgi:amino acid adenylation domain-containing protein